MLVSAFLFDIELRQRSLNGVLNIIPFISVLKHTKHIILNEMPKM